MKIKEKNQIFNKKAINFSKAVILSLFLVTSVFYVGIPTINAGNGSLAPKTIWGYVTYCNGGAAVGASVVVSATSYPDETTTTDGSGAYQVDVGPDTGTEWPDGTSFTVTATLGSWSGSNTGTVSGSVTRCDVSLNPPTLVADASATPTTIVAGETVSFNGEATGGATPYTWYWDFGGDGTSTQEDPSHTFNTQGTYNCVLTVTDACSNTDTDTVTITVNPALGCDAGGPYSGTRCNPVQFDGTATGGHPPYTYSWTFGDGGSGSVEDPSHQYTSDGSYTATLTVTDNNLDTAVDTASVSISTSPVVAEAGGPYSGTICNPVSFSGSASGGCSPYTYSWTFGDGGSSSGQFPSHQYTGDGTYTATVTVTDDIGQIDTDTSSVTISTPTLVADANGPYSGKAGKDIDFEGDASGGCSPYSFNWDFGDGGSGTGQYPSHTYQNPGEYTVILTVTDDKGQDATDTTTATVNPATVIADAGGPYYGNVDEEIQFFGNAYEGVPPYSFYWDFDDGGTSNQQNPTHIYTNPSPSGGYEVILTVDDSESNTDWDRTFAYVEGPPPEDPEANAGGPYDGYVDEDIQFTGSAYGGTPPYSFSWDFDDSDGIQVDSTEQNPTYGYAAEGVYTVTLIVTDDEEKTDSNTTTATITLPPTEPDLECEGTLSWTNIEPGTTLNGNFIVNNNGAPGSELNWEIESYPEWGTWTFTPSEGSDLTPEGGSITVEVTLVAPKIKNKAISRISALAEDEYSGNVKVVNKDNLDDFCQIPVTLTVSKTKVFSFFRIYEFFIYHFPLFARLLQQYFS